MCDVEIETNRHLFCCSYYQPWKKTLFSWIESLLLAIGVSDKEIYSIIGTLCFFYENTTTNHNDQLVNNIFYLQSDVSLDHFFCGHLTSKFDAFFQNIAIKPTE